MAALAFLTTADARRGGGHRGGHTVGHFRAGGSINRNVNINRNRNVNVNRTRTVTRHDDRNVNRQYAYRKGVGATGATAYGSRRPPLPAPPPMPPRAPMNIAGGRAPAAPTGETVTISARTKD